jgi:hypothetical protein
MDKRLAKQCPDNDGRKANFDKYIKDYLKAIAEFPNVGDQLIHWLCMTKKPALMPMHKLMWRKVQLLSYPEGGYLCKQWKYPWRKRRVNKSSLRSPRHINSSLRT